MTQLRPVLTKQSIDTIAARAKEQLQYPRAPTELRGYISALMDIFGSEDLFNRTGLTFVCECYVAAELGIIRGASTACLVNADRPDFELHFGNKTELYELVEADRLGRKRGDEHKATLTTRPFPVEEWTTGEEVFRSICARAEKKAQRAKALAAKGTPYPEQTRLLFYLNLVDFGAHTEEIEAAIQTAVEPAREWFSSIWVLWKSRAYQV